MIKVGLGIVREVHGGVIRMPCVHPPYALVYRPEVAIPDAPPKTQKEDWVFCERCAALLAVTPDGA